MVIILAGTVAGAGCYHNKDGGKHIYTVTYTNCKTWITDDPVFYGFGKVYNSFVDLNPSGVSSPIGSGYLGSSGWGGNYDSNIIPGQNGPITGPVNFLQEAHNDNCNSLKKMILNQKIKSKIKTLQTLTDQPREFGFGYSDTADPIELQLNQGSLTSVKLKVGGTYYGGSHTHPLVTAPMFSISDIIGLAILKQRYFNPEDLTQDSKFFFTLTAQHKNDPATDTFSLEIDNYAQFKVFLDSYISMTDLEREKMGLNLRDKYSVVDSTDPDASNNYLLALLKYMNSVNLKGVSVYKATDENLTNWERVDYDSKNNYVKKIPCK